MKTSVFAMLNCDLVSIPKNENQIVNMKRLLTEKLIRKRNDLEFRMLYQP